MAEQVGDSRVLLLNVGPGTWISSDYVERGGGNAVVVELIPQGPGSASVVVEDSATPGAGYASSVDAAGQVSGVTGYAKFQVASVLPYVRVRLTVASGTWSVRVTPIDAGAQLVSTTVVSGQTNLAQVGGAPISLGQKPGSGSLPVVVASDQSAMAVDTELPAAAALADGMANPTTPVVGAGRLAWNGSGWDRMRSVAVIKNIPAQAVTAGTPVGVWTPAAGKRFRLLGWALSLSVAGSVILKDQGAEFMRTPLMAAGVGLVSQVMANGYLSSAANNVLQIDVTASGNVSGFVYGIEE